MFMLLHNAPKDKIDGEFDVPVGITTSVVAVGTPPHQFAAVNQSVLTDPIQLL
jgi:hypothetical protein